jgi:hypothetical protein
MGQHFYGEQTQKNGWLDIPDADINLLEKFARSD